ncbi:histidine kinase dimerization/phospho-acceptor domain-containing protein [Cupriavidus basilensis]
MAWTPDDEALLRSEMRDTGAWSISKAGSALPSRSSRKSSLPPGRLVASVAHQIRNPLAAISQASELLGDGASMGDGGGVASDVDARLLRIIHDNVRRLDQVVADVLQISRRPRTGRSSVQLAQALPEIVDRWRLEMRSRLPRAGDTRQPGRGEINPNVVRLTVEVAQPVVFDTSAIAAGAGQPARQRVALL